MSADPLATLRSVAVEARSRLEASQSNAVKPKALNLEEEVEALEWAVGEIEELWAFRDGVVRIESKFAALSPPAGTEE